jgi:hypothetical protein
MNLLLTRFKATDKSTIGTLAIDGAFFCYTLEDALRWPMQKIQDKTAIDPGVYNVIIDFSQRFKRLMPHVMDVPNFTGIRIHSGNTDADTSGCILLGTSYSVDRIAGSRVAFGIDALDNVLPDGFYAKIQAALVAGDTVTLTITEQAESTG